MDSYKVYFIVFLALVVALPSHAKEFESLSHIKSTTPGNEQTESVKELISRVIGGRSQEFQVLVDPSFSQNGKDTYQIITENGVQKITGSSGVAVAMGFYYYIKYYCNGQFTWAGKQVSLPQKLPSIPSPGIKRSATDRFRYYENTCTVSYSLAWLNWTRWERHIDWMALNGINLPLAFTGQEAMFQKVYMSMGFTVEDMQEHFGGPAFLAWARMGNIRGWGGPMTSSWINNRLALQHKILKRMRSLGMIPVLPGFAGHVPAAITRLYPEAKVSRSSNWANFGPKYSETYMLDFEDPLFKQIGSSFIKAMQNEFGVDHVYNADSFNEITPKSSDPSYLMSASRGVYEAMVEGDPQAIWLMQGWLFHYPFWKEPQIKALLTAIPPGKMIILDLDAEINPTYNTTQSFYGQPFIWCMEHNFGGTMELYGALDPVNQGPFTARNYTGSTMVGTGITPEGIFQNEIVYEFMNENSWRTEPRNISQWVSDFIQQRYGQQNTDADKAWQILQSTVYQARDNHNDGDLVFLTRRPNIDNETLIWYKPSDLYRAWDYLVIASTVLGNNDLFRYDLVDVTRNSLQVISMKVYSDILIGYKTKNMSALESSGNMFIDILQDMERLLASDSHFLLGNWIGDARAWGTTYNESAHYEYNARNQITIWGPNGEIMDYASKQWSGLFADYYIPRWQLLIDALKTSVQTGKPFDAGAYGSAVFSKVEEPFTYSNMSYPRSPTGDSVSIVVDIYSKYRPTTKQNFDLFDNIKRQSDELKQKMTGVWSNRKFRRYPSRTVM